ncbi:MAG: DNRLRE domain-containing protein [Chloroflexi bacterium]|nr:DNRLRE domain-containing protein [Chloroflexota bacterium]
MSKPWLGEIHLVAIYNDALVHAEVQHNCALMPNLANATVTSSADSSVRESNDESNYASSNIMEVRSEHDGRDRRVFLQFDVSAIPAGSTVLNATLRLHRTRGSNATREHEIRQVFDFWLENAITWEDQPRVSSTVTAVTTTGKPDDFKEWNVVNDVQSFVAGTTPH